MGLDEQLALKNRELNEKRDRADQLDKEYKENVARYTADITDLQQTVRRLTVEIQQYEGSQAETRETDEKRRIRLDEWEQNLKGRERRLEQDSADFEHRKRRFKQLQEQMNHGPDTGEFGSI